MYVLSGNKHCSQYRRYGGPFRAMEHGHPLTDFCVPYLRRH